jgi:hypothetical protein
MSLAIYASPFTNESNKQKKRRSTISNVQTLVDEKTEIINLEKDADEQKGKNKRVLDLMNKLKPDNGGSALENFEPLDNKPSNHTSFAHSKHETPDDEKEGMTTIDNHLPKNAKPEPGMFRPNNINQEKMSNFRDTYNGRISYTPKKTVEGLGNGEGLSEKINYMIHLLEQQQAEKTDNVMEEFVLYAMLGVFVIFTVDSFTRAGRYVR